MAARNALHVGGNPGPTNERDARFAQASAWAKSGITPQTGVVYAGVPALLVATANTAPMQVQVLPFHFVQSKADVQGVYESGNDGQEFVTINAAPGSGSRTDVVYIMQQDSTPGTTSPDATTAPILAATSGALPAGAVRVGSVVVPAGVTKLTDAGVVVTTDCTWVAPVGAPRPVRNQSERDAIATKYVGLQVIRLDKKGRIETYTGTGWDSTEWTDLPIVVGGWDAPTGTRWQACLRNNIVYFRGTLRDVDGTFSGFIVLCTLPAGIPAPGATVALSTSSNSTAIRYVTVEPNGNVELQASTASGGWYHIGGSYPVPAG